MKKIIVNIIVTPDCSVKCHLAKTICFFCKNATKIVLSLQSSFLYMTCFDCKCVPLYRTIFLHGFSFPHFDRIIIVEWFFA